MNTDLAHSPLMLQWYECKKKAKDALLLFRLGDFYEAFHEDAHILAREADVALTQRQGVPMSGVPAQAVESYIEKLVKEGFLVAVAEQVESAQEKKGIIHRDVVRMISPGSLISSIPDDESLYFGAIARLSGPTYGLALVDLSIGELRILETRTFQEVIDELFRRYPKELLLSHKMAELHQKELKQMMVELPMRLTQVDRWHFDLKKGEALLKKQLDLYTLDGVGLQNSFAGVTAAGALLSHIQEELLLSISQVKSVVCDQNSSFMAIDQSTQRNLELISSSRQGGSCTLLKLLNGARTPMGARLFQEWLTHPLLSITEITKRQEAIKELQAHLSAGELLQQVRDVARLMTRAIHGNATPQDLIQLKNSLRAAGKIQKWAEELSSPLLKSLPFPATTPLVKQIEKSLVEEPENLLGKGRVIREGVDFEMDELIRLKARNQLWIANYQNQLRKEMGVKTLKIVFNKVFGYCIEVSRAQAEKMPTSFERRQTLANCERFISPALKEYEEQILGAEERIEQMERKLYLELLGEVARYSKEVEILSQTLATLDVLLACAKRAKEERYVCPTLHEGEELIIEEGRHPIIEASCLQEPFIANGTEMKKGEQMLLITGPNMGGKSTYIRQVALITIMAQMGSFVPAKRAHLPLIDKLFSRIGASDNLYRGQSTFMVEMSETAYILNNATSRSLVILDEIGRGTTTFDGISIAWAVAEHLIAKGCKTLFATHYWELTHLKQGAVKNMQVSVQEEAEEILLLHKIIPGASDKSYGIHVARLAGLPQEVIACAKEKLKTLEEGEQVQQHLAPSPLNEQLKALDLSQMTPFQALETLLQWQAQLN